MPVSIHVSNVFPSFNQIVLDPIHLILGPTLNALYNNDGVTSLKIVSCGLECLIGQTNMTASLESNG